ncbi:MAG: cheR [Phenylobacterium sp.]|nr:cheR [Phenylobacterium sp.]
MVAALCAGRAGLRVDPEKEYLLENRLGPVARREGFATLGEMLQALRDRDDDRLAWAVVEAMSPAETAFFRDPATFEAVAAHVLEDLAGRRDGRPLKVWVAACGAGQEVYSLAMLLDEQAGPGVTVELCASDLSERRLEKARSGVYSQFEVQRGLPAVRLVRHFDKPDENFVLTPRIRQAVRWRRVNLLDDLSPFGRFDLIFCRNILGGLLEDARTEVLGNLTGALAEGGYLVLGLGDAAPGLAALSGHAGVYRAGSARRAVAA